MTAEERILYRENKYRRTLAELNDVPYRPLSLAELKTKVVEFGGEATWEKLVLREKERLLSEEYRYRYYKLF
jgi:hypothetical protein